jgi:hypothetical protein
MRSFVRSCLLCVAILWVGPAAFGLVHANQPPSPPISASGPSQKTPSGATSAASPAAAPASSTFLFRPSYLPREVTLEAQEVAAIRSLVVNQVSKYHESLIAQNKAATVGHELWIADQTAAIAHFEWIRKHNRVVFEEQRFFGVVIFWVVIGIVAISIALTVYQFARDSRIADASALIALRPSSDGRRAEGTRVKATETETVKAAAHPQNSKEEQSQILDERREAALRVSESYRAPHSITLSPTGVQLGSQVIGLAVLAFSLGFFYLYLEKVYPITVAPLVVPPTPPATSPK